MARVYCMLLFIVLISAASASAAEMRNTEVGVLGIYLGMPQDEFLRLCSARGLRLSAIPGPEGGRIYGGGGIDIEDEKNWMSVTVRQGKVRRIYCMFRPDKTGDPAGDSAAYFKRRVSLIMDILGEPVYNDQAYIISSVLANWETDEYSVTVFNLRSESVTVEYELK